MEKFTMYFYFSFFYNEKTSLRSKGSTALHLGKDYHNIQLNYWSQLQFLLHTHLHQPEGTRLFLIILLCYQQDDAITIPYWDQVTIRLRREQPLNIYICKHIHPPKNKIHTRPQCKSHWVPSAITNKSSFFKTLSIPLHQKDSGHSIKTKILLNPTWNPIFSGLEQQ